MSFTFIAQLLFALIALAALSEWFYRRHYIPIDQSGHIALAIFAGALGVFFLDATSIVLTVVAWLAFKMVDKPTDQYRGIHAIYCIFLPIGAVGLIMNVLYAAVKLIAGIKEGMATLAHA